MTRSELKEIKERVLEFDLDQVNMKKPVNSWLFYWDIPRLIAAAESVVTPDKKKPRKRWLKVSG